MKINLPEKVNQIIHKLQANGYEAYAVGGCVRDSLLGRQPEDWDITTSALPEETKALFSHTFDTGIEHGTVTVLLDKDSFEVTTYRIDGKYEDSRHPKEVTFTRSLTEDLLRRDFTINAMAYNDDSGIIDKFGGFKDLADHRIRCVGKAEERFSEDALRILRGVRFAAQLNFDIDPATKVGMRKLAPTLANISAERIQVELVKMLCGKNPERLREAYELGITKVFLPEFDKMMETSQENPHHMYSVGDHTIHAICNVPADKVLRLTMLLHDVGKPGMKTMDQDGIAHFPAHPLLGAHMAREIMHRLKFDNDTLKKVTRLVEVHDYRMPATPKNVRRAMNEIGEDLFPYYIQVRRADALAQSDYKRQEKLETIGQIEAIYKETLALGHCVSLKDLAVTGSDLIAAGMTPGKEIGETLRRLLDLVIEEPELNTKEELLKRCK